MVAAKDFAAASTLHENMETHIKEEEAKASLRSATGHGCNAEAKKDAMSTGRAVAARRQAECEERCRPLIAAMVAERRYVAAADLQAKMDNELKDAVITGHEDAESLGSRDAPVEDARARRRAEIEGQYMLRIDAMVAANDYATAARLQEEMEKRIAHEMTEVRLPSASGQGRNAEANWATGRRSECEDKYAPLFEANEAAERQQGRALLD